MDRSASNDLAKNIVAAYNLFGEKKFSMTTKQVAEIRTKNVTTKLDSPSTHWMVMGMRMGRCCRRRSLMTMIRQDTPRICRSATTVESPDAHFFPLYRKILNLARIYKEARCIVVSGTLLTHLPRAPKRYSDDLGEICHQPTYL